MNELEREIAQLEAKRRSILAEKRKQACEEVRAAIRLYGFTPRELGLGSPGRGRAKAVAAARKAMYRNPGNPAQTWHGGKGPRPKWVRALLDAGMRLEDLLIRR